MKTRQIDRNEWAAVGEAVDADGYAVIDGLLTSQACVSLAAKYEDDDLFRSRVIMARHGFGRGEYQYFRYPLPDIVSEIRTAAYPYLAELANRWQSALDIDSRYPPDHGAFLAACHDAGQPKPTPLLLKYGAGDYNCLHQDRYGDILFPLQMTVLLSDPGTDFTGGEFALTEQRPRMQSRVSVVPLRRGDAVVFPVQQRPVEGTRGVYRVNLRHGVSRVRSGTRFTLGVIFHDAA